MHTAVLGSQDAFCLQPRTFRGYGSRLAANILYFSRSFVMGPSVALLFNGAHGLGQHGLA